MPDTTITATDQSLNALLRTEVDFPGYALDLCSGYVSTDGVLLLKRMLKKAPRVRDGWVESYESGQRFSDAVGRLRSGGLCFYYASVYAFPPENLFGDVACLGVGDDWLL